MHEWQYVPLVKQFKSLSKEWVCTRCGSSITRTEKPAPNTKVWVDVGNEIGDASISCDEIVMMGIMES